MVRYSFLVRLSHPLLHAGLSRRILDYPIRPHQHVGRNRQADLLGCFQVDDQLELRRLLHREIGWFGTFKNLVHIRSRPPEQIINARPIGHKPAVFRICLLGCMDRGCIVEDKHIELESHEFGHEAWNTARTPSAYLYSTRMFLASI
jgi:hypothetical protein